MKGNVSPILCATFGLLVICSTGCAPSPAPSPIGNVPNEESIVAKPLPRDFSKPESRPIADAAAALTPGFPVEASDVSSSPESDFVGATWSDEIRYLKYWLRRRIGWLDRNFFGTCTAVPAATSPRLLSPPAPVNEPTPRGRNCCGGATAYIALEGPVDPTQAVFACPKD